MIFDAHTHYGVCFEDRDGTDPTNWLSGLLAEGVERALVCGHRAFLPGGDIPSANDALAKVVARMSDFAVPFATVHPLAGRSALDEAERCLRGHRMKGIKLHPWLQGFASMFGGVMHELCDLCGEAGAPIIFHDGTSNVSMPSQVATLAEAHPGTTFILGHAGLMHLWRQAAEAAALFPNMYVVLCGPHPAALRYICDRVPTERILWGSDYGFAFVNVITYRRRLMDRLGLAQARYRAIMWENAARLFPSA